MECPKCGKSMWDNRSKKASGEFNPKSPDYACKDKACGGAIWPEKDTEASNAHSLPSKTAMGGDNSIELAKLACMVVSAEIKAGKAIEHPFKRILDGVKALKTGLSDVYKKAEPIPAEIPEVDVDADPIPVDDEEKAPF